jgi:hypothetical protein
MLTPFEEIERRTQQFVAKLLIYNHVNELVARDEFLMEQLEEVSGSDRLAALRASLPERRQINRDIVAAANMVEEMEKVSA